MATKIPKTLLDSPQDQLYNWAGFSDNKDKTMLPPNYLVNPSQNCFIPFGDKIVPRPGSQIKYQNGNPLDIATIGGYTKYKNFAGMEMDVKAYRDITQGEQVLVLFDDLYVPITKSLNTSSNGNGKIYFSTYTDSTLDFSDEKRIPRLCWVNGFENNGKGVVFSWSGGISKINSVTGTTISVASDLTWRGLGFTVNKAGTGIDVTVNGTVYTSTNTSELNTNTLTIGTHSLTTGLVVSSTVEEDELVAPADLLKQNKNYMYYGNFLYPQWWMSNQYGRPSITQIGQTSALQNDLVIAPTSYFTGTGKNTYKITIDSVTPAIPAIPGSPAEEYVTQKFIRASGEAQEGGGMFTSWWNTSSFNSFDEGRINFKMVCIADYIITGSSATLVGDFENAETVVGLTSGAVGQTINGKISIGVGMGGATSMRMISGQFIKGETVRGQSSGATVTLFAVQRAHTFQFFKDDVLQTSAPFNVTMAGTGNINSLQVDLNGIPIYATITGVDFENVVFHPGVNMHVNPGDYFELQIERIAEVPDIPEVPAQPDTFTWQKNNGEVNSGGQLSSNKNSPNTIDSGIKVYWIDAYNHNLGDWWVIDVNQEVKRPWASFYYTVDFTSQQPIRRPGEGYIYNLPSNFWTMDTFEESMYVNTSNGEWGYTNPIISADLLSEDISFIPLKQVIASKVLYPYLTGHNRNDLLFIDENKNLTSMGRLQLMERVQMKNMSDFIIKTFKKNSWIDGSIIFQDDRTWLSSPRDNSLICFDEKVNYWQPPQIIPNLGLLTIINNDLYSHSYLNTATRHINDPEAIGDDGVEYTVIARSSTYDHGNRWNKKTTNMGFWEGYVWENPKMKMSVLFDVDGCSGVKTTDILPVFCSDVLNNGVFGGSEYGKHEFGGDETIQTNYARYLYDKIGTKDFYFSSVEFYSREKKHTYEILSMGINLSQSKSNNKEYRSPESSIDNLLPI